MLIENYPDDYQNYNRLMQIEKLLESPYTVFTDLRIFFEESISYISNQNTEDAINHLIALCALIEEDYEAAMEHFDDTISRYPNTDRSFYAELDILAASLLIGSNGVQKAGKYSAITASNYRERIKVLLGKSQAERRKENLAVIPTAYELFQNYPNPFNPVTNINFNLPEISLVELTVYNILGQKVVTLKNEILEVGSYSVPFNADKLPSGVYLYKIQAGDFISVKKMLLLK